MKRRLGFASLAVGIALGLATSLALPTAARAQGFHAVHSPDGIDVWAVGDGGVVYRSSNAGADYFSSTAGSGTLRSVATQGLVALVTADNGVVWRSTNGGGTWTSQTLPGNPHLYGVAFPSSSTAYVAGANGGIWKTTNGGLSWTQKNTPTSSTLRAIRFTSVTNGWAVGDAGAAIHTTDGGANWTLVNVSTPNRLRAVDLSGNTIWMVGERGTCVRSTNGGTNWQAVNLKLDSRSDVRAVQVTSPDSIWIGGGGGFVRRSTDGGATWTYMQHRMHGPLTGLSVVGSRAQFCSSKHRTVFRTVNNGALWTMPTLGSMTQTFVNKFTHPGNVRGSTIQQSPVDESTFYAAVNRYIYRTRNEGETWQQIGQYPSAAYTKSNAFIVSRKDTNTWISAVSGTVSDRLLRTTDAGATWDTVLVADFGEYGIPLEQHPDNPDVIYFGGDFTRLRQSTDLGVTWTTLGSDSAFRSPCDIVVVPDSSNIILVGDGITGSTNPPGQYYKSVDGGLTFELKHSRVGISGASEIPGMACSRLRNNATMGTNWSAGGVQRTLDYGETWPTVNPSPGDAWGADIARDDPNLCIFGIYGGAPPQISYDGGTTWNTISVSGFGSNYSLFARDREVIIAEQSGGFWKLQTTYPFTASSSQTIGVVSPNGGEEWAGGSMHNITWNQLNVAAVRIEYQRSSADPWTLVAEVPAASGSYAWTVPYDLTLEAKIRVLDAWDLSPSDACNADFIIRTPTILADPVALSFGETPKGGASTLVLSIENNGTGTLLVSSVTTSDAAFTEGRTTMSIPPSGSDTIGVTFRPTAGVEYSGTLDIASNGYGSPVMSVPLNGPGVAAQFAAYPSPLAFDPINPGATARDTIHIDNAGNGTLTIYSVTVNHPEFYPSRTSFTIPQGASDTILVTYHPLSPGLDTATVSIAASDTAPAHAIAISGEARAGVAVNTAPPTSFALAQNQPNPFGLATQIRYGLPQAAHVRLEVFNLAGQRVATLVRQDQSPGWYTVPFGRGAANVDGTRMDGMPSGVYFYRLSAGPYSSTRKMLYVR